MTGDRTIVHRADPHTSGGGSFARRLARQALLERYLLGRLDEGARAVLRATAIANPQVFAEVRETELDLLDALAGGTLDRDRARVVHARLIFGNRTMWPVSQALAEHAHSVSVSVDSPARRASVFAAAVPPPPALEPSARPSPARSVRHFALIESVDARWKPAERRPHVFSSQLRVWPAAAVVVLAAGLWFTRPVPPAVSPVTTTAAASVPAITLGLTVDDSSAASARSLRLTPGTSRLRIDVELPPDTPSPVDVAVQNATGRVLWSMRGVAASSTDNRLTVSVPAEALTRGRLSLVVSAADGSRPARRMAFSIE